jgi:hypothetical protein
MRKNGSEREGYFGLTSGLPPGEPGGGTIGMLCGPGLGVGASILRSTFPGGLMIPPERESCSLVAGGTVVEPVPGDVSRGAALSAPDGDCGVSVCACAVEISRQAVRQRGKR